MKKAILTPDQQEVKARIDKGDHIIQKDNRLTWDSDGAKLHTRTMTSALYKIYGRAEYMRQLSILVTIL